MIFWKRELHKLPSVQSYMEQSMIMKLQVPGYAAYPKYDYPG